MNRIKILFTLLLLAFVLTSCRQETCQLPTKPAFKVLAKFLSFDGGDKYHSANFEVIKCLSDSVQLGDTIKVWYYNHQQPRKNIDTVLLSLDLYNRQSQVEKDNLHCIDDNGTTGIKDAKIDNVSFDYWEGCELGNSNCNTLEFERKSTDSNWFLILPCGGTETVISISGQNYSKELHFKNSNRPPYLELSNLSDGKYSANMRACGLGGLVLFNLKTKN